MTLTPDDIIGALGAVVSPPAGLHEPLFMGNEWAYVKECIDTGWVSTAGSYVTKFEGMLAAFTGARHVIATSTGTAALHAILVGVGVKHDTEVIAPSLTFVGTANAISYIGAVPHFADCEATSLGIDCQKLRAHLDDFTFRKNGQTINKTTGRRIAAIVCMHTFGHPSDIDGLVSISKDFDIPLIEDAAESIGSTINGQHTGTFGVAAALSFNGNKTITTGGGGAIMTDSDDLAAHLRHLTTTAKVKHAWEYVHDEVGFNYRLPNINAALGCAQVEMLPSYLSRKRALAESYRAAFADMPGVHFIAERIGTCSNYWLNAIRLDAPDFSLRDAILQTANDSGFGVRPAWRPLHMLPTFKDAPKNNMNVSEALYAQLINIPSSVRLAANGTHD